MLALVLIHVAEMSVYSMLGGMAYFCIKVPGKGSALRPLEEDLFRGCRDPSLLRTVSCETQLVFPELSEPCRLDCSSSHAGMANPGLDRIPRRGILSSHSQRGL